MVPLSFFCLSKSLCSYQVWDVSCGKTEGLIGGATVLLFNSKMQMKSGKQKLRLWQGKEADGSFPTSTPGKVSDTSQLFLYNPKYRS